MKSELWPLLDSSEQAVRENLFLSPKNELMVRISRDRVRFPLNQLVDDPRCQCQSSCSSICIELVRGHRNQPPHISSSSCYLS